MGSYKLHVSPDDNYLHLSLSGALTQTESQTAIWSAIHGLDALSPGFTFISDALRVSCDEKAHAATAQFVPLLHDALVRVGVGLFIRVIPDPLHIPRNIQASTDHSGLSPHYAASVDEALSLAGISRDSEMRYA